jgi:hypothetical protein
MCAVYDRQHGPAATHCLCRRADIQPIEGADQQQLGSIPQDPWVAGQLLNQHAQQANIGQQDHRVTDTSGKPITPAGTQPVADGNQVLQQWREHLITSRTD